MATAEQIVHVSEFTNEPFIDFTKAENRARMEEALKKVKAEFGREYPMWLNGKKVTTTEKRTSTNPSRPMEVIGIFQNATAEMARQAVEDAHKYFGTWKRVPSQERAKFLFGAAQIVRERKSYDRARRRALARLRVGMPLYWKSPGFRDELHER